MHAHLSFLNAVSNLSNICVSNLRLRTAILGCSLFCKTALMASREIRTCLAFRVVSQCSYSNGFGHDFVLRLGHNTKLTWLKAISPVNCLEYTHAIQINHEDSLTWKCCSHCWPFCEKCGLCEGNPSINGKFIKRTFYDFFVIWLVYCWTNSRSAGDLWHHDDHVPFPSCVQIVSLFVSWCLILHVESFKAWCVHLNLSSFQNTKHS